MTSRIITEQNIQIIIKNKNCTDCNCCLTVENVSISKLKQYRYICKKCLCKETSEYINKKDIGDVSIYLQNKICKMCDVQLDVDNIDKYTTLKMCKDICKDCHYKEMTFVRRKLKQEVIDEYGGSCTCCDIKNQVFLTIDHIDNSGSAHRKELSNGDDKSVRNITGHKFYTWLKKQGYPKDNYQILCFNCNWAKHILGTCPCQEE